MNAPAPIRSCRKPAAKHSEEGFTLLAVMFLLALLVLSLAVAVPRMARSIQRDREVETMERGKQYIRGIQLYYRKFHAYPPNVDALVKTSEIRFVRKKYTDPLTGKDDWKPIMFGQNKVPTAMGFFGQPLAGSTIAGTGPSGGNGVNGATPAGSLFGNPGDTTGSGSSSTGGTDSGTSGGSSTTGTAGAPSTGASGTGTGTTGQTGQTFGGAGIIGFSPGVDKQGILVYKKKDRYSEWEFTYDPAMEMKAISTGGAGLNGQPAAGMSNPIGSSGVGSTTNSSTSTPTTTPTGTPAPQP